MTVAVLVPVLTALVGAFAGYLTLRRKASGRIATTEADRLWAVLMDQLATRDARIVALEARVAELERERHV